MSTDERVTYLVEKLRRHEVLTEDLDAAADEIERLRNKVFALTLVAYGTPENPRDPLSAVDVSGDTCDRCGTYIHPGATHVCLR